MTLVALIDGPLASDHPALHARIDIPGVAPVVDSPAGRHAAAMAAAITAGAPDARIVSIAVFAGSLAARADALGEALAAAADTEATLVHCSLGLSRYDPALAEQVSALLRTGRTLVAASAARGGPVWPAALPEVIAVQGDARCNAAQWSRLALPHADYGACPRLDAHAPVAGASVAAAHLTGILARLAPPPENARQVLDAGATFHGREHRTGPAQGG